MFWLRVVYLTTDAMPSKREVSRPAAPSRQVISVHISCARASASAFTEVGWCSPSRRISLGGRPRPDHGLGGSGAAPCAQTEVFDRIAATYLNPSAVTPVRSCVSLP